MSCRSMSETVLFYEDMLENPVMQTSEMTKMFAQQVRKHKQVAFLCMSSRHIGLDLFGFVSRSFEPLVLALVGFPWFRSAQRFFAGFHSYV